MRCARSVATTRSSRTPSCAAPSRAAATSRSTELLDGPTAIAFVRGDVSAVAKALRDFARAAPGARRQGRRARRRAARRKGARRPRRPAEPRGAARACSPAPSPRRCGTMAGLLKAAAPEPRLRPVGAPRVQRGGVPGTRRPAPGERGDRRGPTTAPTPRRRRDAPPAAEAPAATDETHAATDDRRPTRRSRPRGRDRDRDDDRDARPDADEASDEPTRRAPRD